MLQELKAKIFKAFPEMRPSDKYPITLATTLQYIAMIDSDHYVGAKGTLLQGPFEVCKWDLSSPLELQSKETIEYINSL